QIILAVNGHAQSFGFFKRRLMHIFLYASMTRALHTEETRKLGGNPRWGITPSDPVGSTIRRISGQSGDRIIVRNQASFVSSMQVPDRVAIAKRTHHERSFAARFEHMSGIEMEHSWGGKLCLSLNDVPAFGAIEDGITAACCQNGLGTARGTLSGIVAADLVTGNLYDNHQSLERMLSYPEPKKLPIEPFATIGATLTIKYREWRAGKEV
ncbi:MAG: FAD-binding oxidoreductase, partial [Candidatus Puniceispirillum sp.]|nr:FAD-binding oxidoreductase [Candidatus Puniceispirillum sp.]